ncbi:MAG: cation transporter [Chlamydiales bacterium]|nr:cation transporter [Chlamydiales bacterium]
MKTTYFIDGMHCQQCVGKVKAALGQLPGVTALVVTIGKAEIESTDELSRQSIESALLKAGDYRLATKTWAIKTYIPLIIAFGSVVLWTLLRRWWLGWEIDAAMYDFMGAFFLIFGALKVVSWSSFAQNFQGYDPLAAKSPFYAYIYPALEIFLGIAYQFRLPGQPLYDILTVAILGCTTWGVIQALSSKQKIKCACLGGYFNIPITWFTVFENVLMIGMAIISI